MIQKGNIKLLESIITATEDGNIGQNVFFFKMTVELSNGGKPVLFNLKDISILYVFINWLSF